MGVKYNIHDPNDDKYYYCCSNDCPCNDDHDIFTSTHGNNDNDRSSSFHDHDPA